MSKAFKANVRWKNILPFHDQPTLDKHLKKLKRSNEIEGATKAAEMELAPEAIPIEKMVTEIRHIIPNKHHHTAKLNPAKYLEKKRECIQWINEITWEMQDLLPPEEFYKSKYDRYIYLKANKLI